MKGLEALEKRIIKLEQYRLPRKSYVIRVSNPKTDAELAELAEARREGRAVAVMPWPIASAQEWAAKYGAMRDQS